MLEPTRPKNETERLAALYRLAVLDTPPEERFDRITRLASEIIDAPIAYIAMVDSERQWFKASCGLNAKETTRGISFCGHTILNDAPLVIPDAAADPRFADNPQVTQDPFIRAYVGYPLSTADGFRVGTLCIADHVPRRFDEKKLTFLGDLARVAEAELNLINSVSLQSEMLALQRDMDDTNKALEVRNEFIVKSLGCHLTDEVVAQLLSDPEALKLGGDLRTVTILMADIRGFTPLSRRLPADEVVNVLNSFLGAMVEVVVGYGGTVDKFMGDGVIVLFGAPTAGVDDPGRAVACAIDMQRALAPLNAANVAAGLPAIGIGIGIDTGDVVAGNIGSASRMNYSVIGNAVNLAARLESVALPGQILVSEATVKAIQAELRIDGAIRVKIKGVDDPVAIYDVGGIGGSYGCSLEEARGGRIALLAEPVA